MTRDDLQAALTHDNVQAFLRLIRQGESSQNEDAYQIMFGGSHFESFADHPRQLHTIKGIASTAAGAYQFLSETWDSLVKQYGFPDFSPQCQNEAAVALIAGRKALDDVIAGRLDEAISKCGKEWASLPGSPYGQPVISKTLAHEIFVSYGGRIAEAPIPQVAAEVPPTPRAAPSPTLSEKVGGFMGPFVIPVLQALSSFIPALGKLGFGSGSEVAQRNIAAGALVADKLVEVTQAVNLQEAAEKIQSDPAALAAAKDAVQEVIYSLSEAGSGGIEAARKNAGSTDQAPFWHQGAFWVSIILIAMPFMLLADVFYVHPDTYDGNLRTQIVTAVLLVISMVGAFWLGTSFGSQKKDALLAGRQA